ncbi:putative ATPase [Saccharothrix carnea]|uniref:Putative ATPase n=1 Tax=Saccharothrix carnea TaxID=1280637 RepID=A0A2P8ICE9_SACCR|nr:tetratricopeptide repeat protein [Saccharothrix carnea]PSL56127.1 putative ATPase [Saccharothrix carnea]
MTEDPVRNLVDGQVVGNIVQARNATVISSQARPIAVAGLPPPAVFIGREGELTRLASSLEPRSDDTVPAWAIGGLPGVGKTALAVFAAHRAVAAGWFPGGVVMIDLRGYDQPNQRITPSTALGGLLGALGVASEHIPPDQADRVRLWRSLLADRERMLVVADNVSGTDQVIPLLPGDSRHRVLITSRHRLAGLDHTRLLDLDVLNVPDAVRMLVAVLGIGNPDDTRVADDKAASERVARLCGGLPLAVRVAAAMLVADPERTVADLADALADERHRLRELDYDGNLAVRAAFDLSYALLDPDQARLLRLTALDPGPDVALDTITAITDTNRETTRRLIRQLRAAHLLQPGRSPDRWRMHDLMRLYAADKADADPERDQAIERMLDHYLAEVHACSDRHGLVLTGAVVQAVDADRANLISAIDLAHRTGHLHHVVQLANGLAAYLDRRKLLHEWISIDQTALTAARRIDDPAGEAELLVGLGFALSQLGRTATAMKCLREALPLFRELGDRVGFGVALNRLGAVYRQTDRPRWAVRCHLWARDLFVEAGVTKSHVSALHNLAVVHRQQGEFDRAVVLHQEVVALCREADMPLLLGRSFDNIGVTYREMGRFDDAIECHNHNLRIAEEQADTHGYARTLVNLAVTYRAAGRADDAAACQRQAERIFEALPGVNPFGPASTG